MTEQPTLTDPVHSTAAVAKLYLIAALDEAILELARIRSRWIADLSGPTPFTRLLAADELLRSTRGYEPDRPLGGLNSGDYSAAMRDNRSPHPRRTAR